MEAPAGKTSFAAAGMAARRSRPVVDRPLRVAPMAGERSGRVAASCLGTNVS